MVAVTEVCVVVWRKEDWSVVTRVKYWSEVMLYTVMILSIKDFCFYKMAC